MIASRKMLFGGVLHGGAPRAWHLISAIICAYVLIGLAIIPVAARPGPQMPGIIPLFVAGVLVTELATSFLLLVRFMETRTWSVLLLGCAYVYSALMAGAQLLTFPGAVLADRSLVGTTHSTAWIFILWIAVFSLLTFVAIIFEARARETRISRDVALRAIAFGAAASVSMAIAGVLIATLLVDHLPALIEGPNWTSLNRATSYLAIGLLCCSVLTILFVIRGRDELFLWLALALTAMAVANVLSGAGGGRYTIGWSVGRLSWLVSASVLFLFFMVVFTRQHRSLEQRVVERTAELQRLNEQLQRTLGDRTLLMREQQHRSKNLLSVVQSIAARTLSSRYSIEHAKEALEGRLRALATAHTSLLEAEHSGADLAEIVKAEVNVFSDRVVARGPRFRLGPQAAQMFALVVHELATNAVKHGALSSPQGRVTVTWSIDRGSRLVLHFRWQERDGPPVKRPQEVGFGRTILETLVAEEFGTAPRIDYGAGGLTYELDVEESRLQKGA